MSFRRSAAILAIVAMVFAACNTGTTSGPSGATAAGCKVGVAWATFQEERYGLRDEPALKSAVEAAGATYIGNDAKLSAPTQAANVEALIAAGAKVIVINAQDPDAILPSVQKAIDAGIPVIAYDRELENAKALLITHDSTEVGRMIARAVTRAQPTGNYAIIKGDRTDTSSLLLSAGFTEILKPFIDSGAIKIPAGAEVNTDGSKPENAQTEMEQILTANDDDIQGVLSQSDDMAGGAVLALQAHGLDGTVKVGGQDGDKQALNRVAVGTQVVSVWKNPTELGDTAGKAAIELCRNPDISKVSGAAASRTAKGLDAFAVLLKPVPISRENLQTILDAKWLTKSELCKDVRPGTVTVCG